MASSIQYTPLPKRPEPFELSASCVPSNLAVLYDSRSECCGYAIAHCSQVVIMTWSEGCPAQQTLIEPFTRSADIDSLTFITGVKWCTLSSGLVVLVVTSFSGFIVMDSKGSKRLFQYRLPHRESKTACCTKGIACLGNCVCIGTSDGHILVFSVQDEGVEFRQQLDAHIKHFNAHFPISCLAASPDTPLASGDENGTVTIWRDPTVSRTQEILACIKTEGQVPCAQLSWWHDLIAVGYENGKVSICSSRGMRLIDIAAHSRSIRDIDIATNTGLMLTLSEDSTFSVWKISGTKQPKVSLHYTDVVTNSLLTGGKFCNSKGTMFGITSYESNTVLEYGQC